MTAAAAEPKYISRLALQANPFSAEVGETGLYLGPEIKQRLDLVLHLLRASNKIPLLYGPNGLGKTTALKALMNYGGDDLRFCFIQAEPSLTTQFMVSRCLQVFGAPQESTLGSNNLQLLQIRLQQLQALQIRPVLLIDDVSKLAEPLRQQLKAWFDWQHEDRYLWRAVITDVTADAAAENERIQSLMLSPIPAQETAAYLLQRLQGVGFNGDSPFNEKTLARFHRQSSGIPAKLNHLAHQFLLGQGKSSALQLPSGFKLPVLPTLSFKWNKWFGLVPLGILLAAILFYQQQINDLFVSDKNTIEEDTLSTDALSDDLPMVIVDEPEKLTSVAEADRLELIELLDELEQTVAESESVAEAESTSDPEPEPEIDLVIEPVTSPQNAPEVQIVEPTVEEEQTAAVPFEPISITNSDLANEFDTDMPDTTDEAIQAASSPVKLEPVELIPEPVKAEPKMESLVDNSLKDKQWIMQQSGNSFTFQLMGTWNGKEVDSFVKKHSLTGNVAVFESMRDDKIWYALIYGVYPSKQVAMRASKQWSSPLNKIKPWLRRYDDVQKQIIDKAPEP